MLDQPPPSEQYSDLSVRFVTAIALAAAALAALWIGNGLLALFMGAMATLMVAELTSISLPERSATALLRVCLLAGAAYCGAAAALSPLIGVALAAIGLILAAISGQTHLNRSITVGYVLICLAVVSICALRHLPGGFWVVLWVAGCVVACDTGAYFAGRRFGGRKLWPSVSPKKTWSGFYGGCAAAVLTSLLLAIAYGGNILAMFVLGALVAVVSVGGDLFESAFKRRHNVKDAGTSLPGHGGLLDRFDGLVAAVLFVGLLAVLFDLPAVLGVGDVSGPRGG